MAQTGNVLIDFTKWIVKWVCIVGLGLGILFSILWCGSYVYTWWTYDRHIAKIEINVTRNPKDGNGKPLCDQNFPLSVFVGNLSRRTINSLNFSVRAHLPDHSNDISQGSTSDSWDDVIPPQHGYQRCYAFAVKDAYKAMADVVIWEVRLGYIEFKE